MSEEQIFLLLKNLDSRLEKLEVLPERLKKLEALPDAIERLSSAIDSHTKVFASSVPLPVVRWIFVIVAILVGGRWGLHMFEKWFGF